MTAEQEMAGLLERWLKLTQAEAGAIHYATWPALREIQAAKASLQKLLNDAKERWTRENPGRASAPRDEHPFFHVICRLLSMEARNEELLAARLRKTQTEKQSLDESARNLRNVRQTYASKPSGIWNCYS
jgi:hypothetical protein